MDYKTFSDAFLHNQRTQEHLVNLLANRVDKSSQFALFLGAGASVTSGVKTSSQMISEWRHKLFASYKGHENFATWIARQDWYDSDEEYSVLFEHVYDQPSQRRAYIEKIAKDAKPSWGYAYLVSLIEKGIFNVVFTTNFDDLINDACYSFTNKLRPMVCSHDSAVGSVRVMSERPKIIKLHGDFLYDSIKNTTSELQSLEANMREKFIEFAKEYGLIVVGYGGSDQSVMDLLDVLVRSSNYFRNGIYWCIRKDSFPGRRLQRLLRNDRVFWVEIEGFDELIADLAGSSGCGLPQAIISPHISALNRSRHLVEKSLTSGHPILTSAYGNTREVYSRIQKALDDVGLKGWELDKKNDDFSELSDHVLPSLKCYSLISEKKFDEASKLARKLMSDYERSLARSAWSMLLDCLLRSKTGHAEARQILAAAPPQAWQHSEHYMKRSYYCLYLCDAKEALTFASRALELNAALTPARVNKALAYLMIGQSANLKKTLAELDAPAVREHAKAAICTIKGDMVGAIHFLQQAIVLGRYSVDSACRDVAFRTLWGNPRFEESMSPFLSGPKFEYPYKDSCLMSAAEKAIHSKMLETEKKTARTRGSIGRRRPRRR